jgi:hypothetical protein
MSERLTCEQVRDRELTEQYAAGKLGEADAESLEAHALACDACWQQLETAVAIRAAMLPALLEIPGQSVGKRRGRVRGWQMFVPVTLAAVALLGFGVAIVLQHRTTAPVPVTRGAVDQIRLTSSRELDGGLRVTWPPVSSVSDYVISVKVDGATILTRETDELQLVIPRERFTSGSRLVIEIAGHATDGATVAEGSLALRAP